MPLAHDWLRRVENVRRESDTSGLAILADAAHPAKGKKSMYLPVASSQGAHPRIVAGRNPARNKRSTPVVLINKSNVDTCRKEYKPLADEAASDIQEPEPATHVADGTATAKIPPAHSSLAQVRVLGKRRREDQDVDGTEEEEDQSTQPHGQDTANAGSSQVATGALPKIFIRIPPRTVALPRDRPPPTRQSLQRSCKKRRID